MSEEQKGEGEEREAGTTGAAAAGSDAEEREDADREEDGDEASGESESEDAEASTAAEPRGSQDDDEDDEGDAGEAAAASGASKKAPARGSAGARLAAAKAAKAAKKAARKAREQAEAGVVPSGMTGGASKPAEEVLAESPIGQAASKASQWAQSNQQLAMGIAAAVIVAVLGYAGWSMYSASQAEAAGALLADAVEIANGEIVPEGEAEEHEAGADTDDEEDESPTFPTREARAEAALAAYQQVVSQHGGTEAARWARLGVAWAHFELGHMDEARQAYEQTLHEAGGDPAVAWRALEGIGFTYEAAQEWDEAIEKYEELSHLEDGAYSAPADYHIARMRIMKGETVEATTALRTLVERLRSESEEGEPEFPYVLAQAEIRLRELDPTAAGGASAPSLIGPGGGGEGGLPAGLEGLPPEILEQLRRQLQEGAAGGEGGGGGGE